MELTEREVMQIRMMLQEIETIIDGSSQKLAHGNLPNLTKLMRALSTARQLQFNFFYPANYSLHRYKNNPRIINGKPEMTPDRQNYPKFKKEKNLRKIIKLDEWK
jgi:hypothetical protein